MPCARSLQSDRPRELRRRVLLPARLRTGDGWTDACILNISSRGLMIQSGRAGPEGSTVELRRGDDVIIARVVWRDGSRAGLQTDDRLPVEKIMSLSQSGNLRVVAFDGTFVERRNKPRLASEARLHGRYVEFIGIAAIAVLMALGIWSSAEQALARPMAKVEAALSR